MDRRRQAPATYDESVLQKSPDPNVWIGQQLEFYSDAYTRQERVTVSVCSFNVDSRKSTADLSTWLRLQNKPSIIAIGLQEVDMSANALLRGETEAMNTWRDLLCATVNADCDWGSASSSRTGQAPYTMIGARQMVGLFLTVFVLKPLLRFTSRIRMNTLATGAMMNTLGNKGAIALRLRIHRTRIVFITAHLAAHQHEVDRRNRDFDSIMSNLDFSREDTLGLSPPSSSAVALSSRTALAGEGAGVLAPWDHDYVFFFGDLNYRIDRYTYDQVVSLVKEQNYSALLKEDQLRRELVRGAPRFKGFQEAEHFSFPPTYRYDEGTSNFDTSEKRRIPAYTDRILWWLRPVRNMTPDRVKENVVLKHFTSFPEICSSDHKPISALFDLALNVEVETERSKIMNQLLNRVTDVGFERLLSPNIEVSTRNISFGVQSFGAYVEQVVVIENKGLSVTEVGIYVLDPKKAEEPSSSPSTTLKTDGNVEDELEKTKLSFAGLAIETCQIHTVRWVGVHPLDNFIFPGEFATFTIECQVDRSTMAFQEFKGPFIGIRQFLLRQVIVVQPRYGQPVMIPVEVLVPSSCFGNTLGNLVSIRPHRPCVEAYAKTHQPSSDSSAAGTDDKRTASVPKELWCLIDVLYRKFCKTPSLFLEIASEQELFAIRDYLDTSLSGPESVAHLETFSPHAIANAVTTFLQSLQVPVIPFELYHAVATANAPKHYTAIFEDMRSVHYNTFMYIVSFLRFLLTEKNRSFNGLSVEAITAGFGPILVQAPRSPSNPLYRSYSSDEHRSAVMNITGFLTWCLTAESLMELS